MVLPLLAELNTVDWEFEQEWHACKRWYNERFDGDLDVDTILFLIGVQEFGKGYLEFTKDEKMDLVHIAVCTLLEPFGFYEFEGEDEAGWPHFKRKKKLPYLKPEEQDRLMKEAIINYTRTAQRSGGSFAPQEY